MDLIEDPQPGANAPEFSVSEITGAVKRVIEGEFGRVRVRGEVGRVYMARSGHLYFDIKDERNVLASVSWKGQVAALTARPEEGMEVVAVGRLTTFGSQSKYQLNVEDLTPAGEGALMAMLERRKKALAAEGLFDPARKRPLPMLPEVIGVVTSPTGAVIRDILHRLRERFPRKVLVWPVAVQGQACSGEVARAIAGFNRLTPGGALPRPDLLIVARGGGSIEDLWGFNEEVVARAVAASEIPLISAVGHETDTTLIDYVSDRRAPTPTAAAEIAVPVRMELMAQSEAQGARMIRALSGAVEARGQRLRDLARGMKRPEELTSGARQRLDLAEARLPSLELMLARRREHLERVAARLSPALMAQRAAAMRQRLNLALARLPGPDLALARRREALGRMDARLSPALIAQRILSAGQRLSMAERQRSQSLARAALSQRGRLDQITARLRPQQARQGLAHGRSQLTGLEARMNEAIGRRLEAERGRLEGLNRLRETLGHKETLRRGYAVVHGADGVVTSASAAREARLTELEFADGRVPLAARQGKSKDTPPGQGSLF